MTSLDGLTTAQASAALAEHGPNDLSTSSTASWLRRMLRPFTDPMVLLLLVACPAYFALGETADAITTLVAIVPIVGIGWFLERRAERALAQLHQLSAPTARVLRDGQWQTLPASQIVPGDLVDVLEGDVVPADGIVAESTQLSLDESMLTGESVPVNATVGTVVSAGTIVTDGSARVTVTATGRVSALGRISALMQQTAPPKTPLQVAMGRLVVRVAVVAAAATVVVVASLLVRGQGAADAALAGVSLLIAAVPEEFTVVYALYLSLGAWHLARRRALVRSLPAAEALGAVTVICTDKTGTVTRGQLEVADIHAVRDTATLLQTGVLACEPRAFDPLDKAIVRHAVAAGVNVEELHSAHLVADWPFLDNRVTHVWRLADGSLRVAVKGSLEAVSQLAGDIPGLVDVHDQLASAGLRVIAFASAVRPAGEGAGLDRSSDERSLAIDGLIGFLDPLRDGVADAVAECVTAGIRVIMVTGDHPETSRVIARQMTSGDVVVTTGAQMEAALPAELRGLVEGTNVFARTRPHQKQLLVETLRAQGEVVAMTGDGINDAPALRAADIGVAMGQRGTAVARDAAAVVLLDDSFNAIVAAVRNGRRIYDNLTRAFGYLIAVHLPIIAGAVIAPLLGMPLLLLPIQLVTLEVLLHPIVSLVFQADPAAPDVMRRPARPADYALSWRALRPPVMVGTCLSAVVVAGYWGGLQLDWEAEAARAFAFTVLLLAQPSLLLVLRAGTRRARLTREFAAASGACVLVAVVSQLVPVVRDLNSFAAFPLAAWPVAVAAGAIAVVLPWLALRRRVRPAT